MFQYYQPLLFKSNLFLVFQNEGVPEEDTTPLVEVAERMSRDGTPTDEVGTTVPTEGPDATVTPPPDTQSPEPEEYSSPRYDVDIVQYEGNNMHKTTSVRVHSILLCETKFYLTI